MISLATLLLLVLGASPLSQAFQPAARLIPSTHSTSRSTSSLHQSPTNNDPPPFPGFANVGFLILAGGTGSRMKASMPKQFLTLRSSPVLHYSLDLFLNQLPTYCQEHNLSPPSQVVLVLDPKYQPEYQPIVDKYHGQLAFANPGKERQGSVENGLNKLKELNPSCQYIAIHDSARPLVTIPEIRDVTYDALTYGAAVLAVPCKATIKQSLDGGMTVDRTIPRSTLYEVHTPQVVPIDSLLRGFDYVNKNDLEVTDDVSIIEALGDTVKITKGEYTNLKITTPEDMEVANAILEERGVDGVGKSLL